MQIRNSLFALLACGVLTGFAATVHAQATFDAQTNVTDVLTSAANTTTFAHTTSTGVNRLLLVAVSMNLRNATGTTVTTVTYGGSPLTLLDAITDGAPDTRTEVWYLLNGPTGNNNVVLTMGGISPGNNVESVTSATTFTNADQSVPPSATATNSSGAASVTLTGTAATDLVIDFIGARETVTLTPNGAQVAGFNTSTGGTNNDIQAASSGRIAATPNTAMSWTLSATRRWTQIAVGVKQATADIEVTQSALPDPVDPGGVLTYTFQIQNNGPSTAQGVTLTDTIPGTTTFVSSNTTLGSCSGSSTVTCNLGTMTVGQTATVSIQVLAPLTGGLIATNTGTVTTTTIDPVTPNTASATAYSLVQSTVCGTQPGKDGAGGTLAGVINSYWPGSANAAAGATSITVGARRGAAVSITAGDLVLVMQMQDAAIDSNNDDRYGNGLGITGGTTGIGAGYTNANNVGRYEYVVATNTVGAAGGALTFTGVSGGGGLVYAYTNANATATQGQRRFQVVRVPQYTTATLGGTVTAAVWNGTSGGILAFDVAGDLALGSTTVNVNGLGFRGGAGLQRAGGGAATTDDYRNTLATNVHGVKGEGIAGTPEWVLDGGANTDVGPQGYPNGDFARGAPGNAGGGGTDGEPTANQDNSGGGGGANWGRGGGGGNTWASNLARGGFGGAPYYDSPGRVVLGGGGGAGARNNSSGIASSGAAGGGIVLVRAGRLTGTGTITANGADAFNDTANDGGGGGGAGGSIVVLTRGGTFSGLTVRANGGRGGDAWRTQAPGVYPGERHGPGGGGGGGYIALNGTPAVSSVTGGASGITTTASDTFGAQPGAVGNVVLTASFDQITGIKSGCTDISVASSDAPDPVIAGNQLTFTQSVTNNSTIVPAYNVVLTQTTPPGTTFVSMTPPPGWSCTTPSIGGTGTVTCAKTDPLAPSTGSGNFTFVVATDPGLANGSTITQPVSTSTSSPEPNTANNSTSTTTSVIRRVDVGVTKAASDPGPDSAFAQGENVTYTLVVSNNGPSRATNVVMTDTLPAGLSFVSVTPGGPTCTQSSGTVTCTYATMNPGATNNISITATITVNTTQIINTANVTRTETDTNATNDSASATISVLAPTAVHMLGAQASQDERGNVVLDWTTTFEASNLGFNIYRVTADGTREQINKHLIAGSALFTRRGTLPSGRTYRWTDRIDARAFAQYYIEDIDLDGTRSMHGPVTPAITASAFFEVARNAATLDEVAAESVFASDENGIDGGLGAPGIPKARPNLTQQWALASQKALSLAVAREGWYRVTKNEIAAAGFDAGNDANGLSLYSSGVEQPLFVDDGGDGRFDATDAIEFYGIGKDTPSSGTRAYWLVREKPRASLTKPSNGNGKTPAKNTMYTYRRVERSVFFTALTNNGDNDNFFGAIVTNAGASQELVVENLDTRGANATLTVVLQGGAAGRHRVRLSLNGGDSSMMTVDDLERVSSTFTIPLARLRNGTNTLTLTALGGDDDITVVESIELTYPRQLLATNDALKVVVAGGASVTVGGFTSDRIRAFDVTDPAQPSLLATTIETSAGTHRATAAAPNGGTRTLVFLAAPRASKPESLALTQPSSWNSKKNAADLLIITHAAFVSATEPLLARRKAEGLQTQVVDVQDVYDEFGYGEHGPEALREFLRRTREWKTPPRYVILLGDASFDPRNYLGLGNYDLVPTKLVATNFMKTASDDWFADFNDRGLPNLAIGRIPARTPADAKTIIDKIVRRTFVNRVNAVADTDFDGAAQWLNGLIPSSYEKKITTANDAFESALTTYVGHGSVELWATGFDGNSAAALRNGTKLPIVAAMTCLNGYFHDLYTTSLAESLLLNPNGGASAVWASSTLTEPVAQVKAATELYRRLFAGARLGDAALAAKAATSDQDVRRSWILFGDPSMTLK
ncbi:MAG TPA: C25 family cysteine peptidase [Thermoanaerobaculia bacterium]|nr:C25 family cysteine peptidase [Thermoanaerobaculia bacterium]